MIEIPPRIRELLEEDPRYPLDAYHLVHEGLEYAQRVLKYGQRMPSEKVAANESEAEPVDDHLTGQQLCLAIQKMAIEHYGRMARIVLSRCGIHSTSDIGDIVYNLIRVGEMKKSKTDRREDFDDVYDFEQVFDRDFKIEMTKAGTIT